MPGSRLVTALTGGVGGSKLVLGLSRVVQAGELTAIVNTGDDFRHLGLAISPDIDTLLYTLSDLADPDKGWGRRDETWTFMRALAAIGGETWFQLGDGDLAMHVERTRRLESGESLSAVTDYLRRQLAIAARILPMSDCPVRTRLNTDEGWLDFQDYFVNRRCRPQVREVIFEEVMQAVAADGIRNALTDPELRAVVICPSNPMLSIDPILAVPGIRDWLAECPAPVIAVSPIIGGRAVKGPTSKMMHELGMDSSASTVALRYADLIDGYIVDREDKAVALPEGIQRVVCNTLMVTLEDREQLARDVLSAADSISQSKR